MEAVVIMLVLATLASEGDLQNINGVSDDISDKSVTYIPKIKLQEFEDHAELQMQTDKPQEAFTPPVPTPKLLTEDATTNEGLETTTSEVTIMPEPLLTPVPVQLTTVAGEVDTPRVLNQTKPSSTKKPSVVGKKGVIYKEPSVVPKKGVGYKEPSVVPKKGVGYKEPSVVPKKGVSYEEPSVVGKKGADPNDLKGSVVARKGVDPNVGLYFNTTATFNNNTSEDMANSTSDSGISSKVSANGKSGGGTSSKSKAATGLNVLTYGEKKKTFSSKVTEANMNLGNVTKTEFESATTSSAVEAQLPNAETVDGTEPAKPPTSNPLTTEAYAVLHSKPTATTDALDDSIAKSESEDISYTPAVVGIVLLVAIVVTVIVVGYRRLRDVWMKRHYARMDFLIDGMYDV